MNRAVSDSEPGACASHAAVIHEFADKMQLLFGFVDSMLQSLLLKKGIGNDDFQILAGGSPLKGRKSFVGLNAPSLDPVAFCIDNPRGPLADEARGLFSHH